MAEKNLETTKFLQSLGLSLGENCDPEEFSLDVLAAMSKSELRSVSFCLIINFVNL